MTLPVQFLSNKKNSFKAILTMFSTLSASSFLPVEARKMGLSGMTWEQQRKTAKGMVERPTRYLQPSVGMTSQARKARMEAPRAQKKESTMIALPRELVGRNSA